MVLSYEDFISPVAVFDNKQPIYYHNLEYIMSEDIRSIHPVDLDNYNEVMNSEAIINYGLYKAGSKKHSRILSECFLSYIVENIDIEIDKTDWVLVVPHVNINHKRNLINYVGNSLKNLMDFHYDYNFPIYQTYVDNDLGNYWKSTDREERSRLISRRGMTFSDNVDLSNKSVILIDDSCVYGSTLNATRKLLTAYNLNLNKLTQIVYVKPTEDVLKIHKNFEFQINTKWFNLMYDKNLVENEKTMCEMIIDNPGEYFLSQKNVTRFVSLKRDDLMDIIQLLKKNTWLFRRLLFEFDIYNMGTNPEFVNHYLIYKKNYSNLC
jgi:hypoxanthine phosphoribosyltransferase